MTDIGQVNMEEIVKKYGEEEMVRLINKIMENNVKITKTNSRVASNGRRKEKKTDRDKKKKRGKDKRTGRDK